MQRQLKRYILLLAAFKICLFSVRSQQLAGKSDFKYTPNTLCFMVLRYIILFKKLHIIVEHVWNV